MNSDEIMDFLCRCFNVNVNDVKLASEEMEPYITHLSRFLNSDKISNTKEFNTFIWYLFFFTKSLDNLNESIKQRANMLENEETLNSLTTLMTMLAGYCNKFVSLMSYITEETFHSSELAFEVSELREHLLQKDVQVQQLSAENEKLSADLAKASSQFEAKIEELGGKARNPTVLLQQSEAKLEEERQQSGAKIEELKERVHNLNELWQQDEEDLRNLVTLLQQSEKEKIEFEEERQQSGAKIEELEEKVRKLNELLQQSEEEKTELKKNAEKQVTVFNLGRQKMLENVQIAKDTGVPRKYNKTRDSYDEKYGEMVRKMYLVMGLSYAKISEQTMLSKETVERLIKVKGYQAADRGQYLEYNGVLTHKSQLPKAFIEASAPPKKRGRPTNEEYMRRKAEQGTASTVGKAVKAVEGTAHDIEEPEFSIFDDIDISE